jgi:hypothetical protein
LLIYVYCRPFITAFLNLLGKYLPNTYSICARREEIKLMRPNPQGGFKCSSKNYISQNFRLKSPYLYPQAYNRLTGYNYTNNDESKSLIPNCIFYYTQVRIPVLGRIYICHM